MSDELNQISESELREMEKFTRSYYARVYEKGVLFSVTCTGSTFKARNTGRDFGKSDSDIPDGFYLGNKLWLPRETVNARDRIHNQARNCVSKRAHKFPITGIHFIPHKLVVEVEEELQTCKAALQEWVSETLADLPNLQEKMLEEARSKIDTFPEYLSSLEKTYSTLDVASAFETDISWTKFQITLPQYLKEVSSLEAMLRHKELDTAEKDAATIRESALARVQRDMQNQVALLDKFVADTEASLRTAYVEHFKEFSSRLRQEGKDLSKANVRKIRELIKDFRELDFIGLDDVEKAMQQVEDALGQSGQISAGSSGAANLLEAFNSALNAATTEGRKYLTSRPGNGRLLSF